MLALCTDTCDYSHRRRLGAACIAEQGKTGRDRAAFCKSAQIVTIFLGAKSYYCLLIQLGTQHQCCPSIVICAEGLHEESQIGQISQIDWLENTLKIYRYIDIISQICHWTKNCGYQLSLFLRPMQ